MHRYLGLMLAVFALAGCATHAATSGRVVIQDSDGVADVRIADRDRRAIEDYYRNATNKKGLSPKRSNTSSVRKGDKLSSSVKSEPLPADLDRLLSPLPSAYARMRVGPDVVLLNQQTRVIVDTVRGVAD